MNILVQAKNMKTTKALRAFIESQLDKIKRLGVPVQRVQVFLENVTRKNNDPHRATVQLVTDIPKRGRITVESKTHDLYLAVGEATNSLMRYLRKEKEKHHDQTRRQRRKMKNEISE
ncbi:MAG: ribosome-associated translation inhibitor RaiA [Candidatus Paceibacterota bacterium]